MTARRVGTYIYKIQNIYLAFTVKQQQFEGPLDLLLDLIDKEKLSINEISLSRVADDYLRFVKELGEINRDELAEFLVIAAQLILIKTRSLLPGLGETEEEALSIEELEKRLEEYKRLKELSREIQRLWRSGRREYAREFYVGRDPMFYPPKKISVPLLRKIFDEVLRVIPKIEKLAEERIKKIITLEEKMKNLSGMLMEKIERTFSDVVGSSRDKVDVIVSFLAMLELARQRFLTLEQKDLFGEITMKKE
ncbi:MAG: hypothetical protein A2934_01200 [Candidatus Sungbacteria bacterium RIFCSPLOWO2_01_FULL_47_10]|uniref:Segregation and condensation protein A n=1 Tax=Candidatus Sungbacteria bacterium RIFCSPLOWO2_01_FULL_47_10 TaxID=1802276 RepID=A0A1G2L3M3_9BACT|nr:MAG: hypothetical protein A2934_01200 [Candidatus Sungbacteria bacterium RIFCSPLOWO2_01_FULL_47_10]